MRNGIDYGSGRGAGSRRGSRMDPAAVRRRVLGRRQDRRLSPCGGMPVGGGARRHDAVADLAAAWARKLCGMLEAGCKNVVGRRMKCTGMRRSVAGTNPVLWQHCAWLDDYWETASPNSPLEDAVSNHWPTFCRTPSGYHPLDNMPLYRTVATVRERQGRVVGRCQSCHLVHDATQSTSRSAGSTPSGTNRRVYVGA